LLTFSWIVYDVTMVLFAGSIPINEWERAILDRLINNKNYRRQCNLHVQV